MGVTNKTTSDSNLLKTQVWQPRMSMYYFKAKAPCAGVKLFEYRVMQSLLWTVTRLGHIVLAEFHVK